jgi:hypothetical protein
MPDWVDYDTSSTCWSTYAISASQLAWDYAQYQRECEQQEREMKRKWKEQAELEEDKKKYPLFFLKEGIV